MEVHFGLIQSKVEGILTGEIEAQRGKVTCLMSYDFLFCGMAHWVLYRSSPCNCVCKESKGIKKWVPPWGGAEGALGLESSLVRP